MSSSCSRRSEVTPAMLFCMTLKLPLATVSRYRKMMFSTIQPIGKNPVATPRIEARIDMPAGIVKT